METKIENLIIEAEEERLILPNFQRGFKWNINDMIKLVKSIILKYPLSSILLYETKEKQFGCRLIGETNLNDNDENYIIRDSETNSKIELFTYLLDGQQRITTLIKVFIRNENIIPDQNELNSKLKGTRFFLDLEKLGITEYKDNISLKDNELEGKYLTPENVHAVIVSKTWDTIKKEIKKSTKENVNIDEFNQYCFEKLLYPITFDLTQNTPYYPENFKASAFLKIKRPNELIDEIKFKSDVDVYLNRWLNRLFIAKVFKNIGDIRLVQEKVSNLDDPDKLANIFETMNSTGMKLTVFDLLVSRLSCWKVDEVYVSLRSLLKDDKIIIQDVFGRFDDKELGGSASKQLPRIFAIANHIQYNKSGNISFKKADILSFKTNQLQEIAIDCCKSLNYSINILSTNLGVKTEKMIPFSDAYTLCSMGYYNNNLVNIKELLIGYYWTVLFTVDIDKDTNGVMKRIYDDWNKLLNNSDNKLKITFYKDIEKEFNEGKLSFSSLLKEDNSGSIIYKAIMSFVMAKSTYDWEITVDGTVKGGKNLHENNIDLDDHHIIPQNHFNIGIDFNHDKDLKEQYKNTILNRIYISKETNLATKECEPHIYLQNIDSKAMENLFIPSEYKDNSKFPHTIESLENLYKLRYELIKKSILKTVKDCFSLIEEIEN